MSKRETFFIADTHFCHEKSLTFAGRREMGWQDWKEMNYEMLYRWNQTVRPSDRVIHVGDVALCNGEAEKKRDLADIMLRLNGELWLVGGNHDPNWVNSYFDRVAGVIEFKNCAVSHIPVHPGQKARFRANIHGHLHDNNVLKADSPYYSFDPWYICVSVEQQDFAPRSWTDIRQEIKHGRP